MLVFISTSLDQLSITLVNVGAHLKNIFIVEILNVSDQDYGSVKIILSKPSLAIPSVLDFPSD